MALLVYFRILDESACDNGRYVQFFVNSHSHQTEKLKNSGKTLLKINKIFLCPSYLADDFLNKICSRAYKDK